MTGNITYNLHLQHGRLLPTRPTEQLVGSIQLRASTPVKTTGHEQLVVCFSVLPRISKVHQCSVHMDNQRIMGQATEGTVHGGQNSS